MNINKICYLLLFLVIYLQPETYASVTKKTSLIEQGKIFARNYIEQPITHYYHVTRTAAHLLFEKKVKKNLVSFWNSLSKETKQTIIFSLFLSGYYSIHILRFPLINNQETTSVQTQLVGGLMTGTIGICMTIIATIVAHLFHTTLDHKTYQTLLLLP